MSFAPCGGQLEREPRSASFFGVDPDPPAHRRHEPLSDEEPEPCARGLVVAAAVELAEDPLALGGGDADALVGDADLDAVRPAPRLDAHRPAAWRVLDRVLDELVEHL